MGLYQTSLIGSAIVVGAPALVIRYTNVEKLVKDKGGAAGGLAFRAAPQTITNKVYSETASAMRKKFAEEGAEVDVQVVDPAPSGTPRRGDLVTGLLLGAAGVGLVWVFSAFAAPPLIRWVGSWRGR